MAVFIVFGLPLFVGLNGWDLHNDEAIYSYSVDRILETDEWLTPRSIEVDGPFLEKPPLKFWLVAGLMRLGVPHDDRGQRLLDALFGALAFVYVCALGQRLAGPICGVSAVMVLFALDRLIFDHGLRSNNMDAALLLSYCGGVYHFARWEASPDSRDGRRHALIVAAYFVLGFLTKFVAALFLPVLCATAYVWSRGTKPGLVRAWREWRGPAILAVALVAPWFIYQSRQFGSEFWRVALRDHIVTRFTASLDPHHLHPWHYYYVETWRELSGEGSQWVATAGFLLLAVAAWRARPPLARLVLSWAIVPYILLSVGTSKVFHYAYPFLPPIALSVGYACALLARAVAETLTALSTSRQPPGALARLRRSIREVPAVRAALVAGAVVSYLVAAWTYGSGIATWTVGDTLVFRNSSLLRPLAIAAALLWLASLGRRGVQTLALAPLIALLPVRDYHPTLMHTTTKRHPLRALRDCGIQVRVSGLPSGEGVYNVAPTLTYHSYYYYLHRLGAWTTADRPNVEDLNRRLFEPGAQTPVLISVGDYRKAVAASSADTRAAGGESSSGPAAVTIEPEAPVLILLPGPFVACVASIVRAGGQLAQLNEPRETAR